MLYLSASIGISLAPSDGDETALLVRNANAALYQAKTLEFHFYTPEMTLAAQDRLQLAGLLRSRLWATSCAFTTRPR